MLVHKRICFDWSYQWGQSTQQTCQSKSHLLLLCFNIHQPRACHRQGLPDYITVAGSWVASAGATSERHPSEGFSAVRSVLNESVSGFHWKFILIPVNALDNKLHALSLSQLMVFLYFGAWQATVHGVARVGRDLATNDHHHHILGWAEVIKSRRTKCAFLGARWGGSRSLVSWYLKGALEIIGKLECGGIYSMAVQTERFKPPLTLNQAIWGNFVKHG